MRWFKCLRWYAGASVLRCSHLNRALCLIISKQWVMAFL
ncbi:TPA: ankyrin repeat domain-containing protein, partial [Vibrio vulnificus]|nr:ankyrin repeat domain-containing protein [Vibrio vulnificus]